MRQHTRLPGTAEKEKKSQRTYATLEQKVHPDGVCRCCGCRCPCTCRCCWGRCCSFVYPNCK